MQHRAAPHDRLVLLEEEADRDDFDAVRLERDDLLVGRDLRALAAEAEHARDRVAPDVGVEDADLLALGLQRGGEVDGQRRLADAALAGADADDVGDLRERALGQPRGRPSVRCRPCFSVSDSTSKPTLTAVTPSTDLTAFATPVWKWPLIGQPGVVSDTVTFTAPVSAMSIFRTIPSVDDVSVELGIDDDLQRLEDLVSRGHGS